jgi:DNA-directed RNA polymerase specialized sigma24 family protein
MADILDIKEARKIFDDAFPDLKLSTDSKDHEELNSLLLDKIHHVELYIKIELGRAVAKGVIPEGKYKVADFVDELFLMAHEHNQDVKESENLLNWLFQQADSLIQIVVKEEAFEYANFKNIDDFAEREALEMQERITIDGNGELVLVDELDECPYPVHDYELQEVFVEDNEADLIDRISQEMSQDQIKGLIELAVRKLPLSARTIFDLRYSHKLNVEDISFIKKISVSNIDQILFATRNHIKMSLERRL